jgi:hypothetical protein
MNHLALRLRLSARAALAVACLALLLCAPAHAARGARTERNPHPPGVSRAKPSAAPAAVPGAAAGMLVAIDPETGGLVPPTADQVRRLTAVERTGLMRTAEGLTEVRLPDGSVMMDLQGRFMEFSLARLDRAGCPHFLCVSDEAELRTFLARRTPMPPPTLEEK